MKMTRNDNEKGGISVVLGEGRREGRKRKIARREKKGEKMVGNRLKR